MVDAQKRPRACEVQDIVVDRAMIPPLTSLKILLTLVLLVYGYLISLASPVSVTTLGAALAGTLPFVVWLLAPDLLEAGDLSITMVIRRGSLIAGAAAVALRYATVRSHDRSRRSSPLLRFSSAILLFATVGIGTANWLVAGAFAVSAVAVARVIPPEASVREGRPPRRRRRDT